ncbi:hypothetical protein RESH_01115 [Rhodopirellula europaea SH398]|uniref:Uncharacterized protein n=1 Tax=Rhodopirellula europaea SH398 TaxID=1263868 RepID=M5SPY5_9BACT|nr:hypothetical protein RESH_01115 [Rhodopirellula europaea SH398]
MTGLARQPSINKPAKQLAVKRLIRYLQEATNMILNLKIDQQRQRI